MQRRPRSLMKHTWAITRITRFFMRLLVKARVARVRVVNRGAVPRRGAVIIASNHVSQMDPIMLWGALPRNAAAMAKAELWRNPLFAPFMWLMGHIPVSRGNPESGKLALNLCSRVLRYDGLIVIYPEGTTSGSGPMRAFKGGADRLAFGTGAPVVPTAIVNSGYDHSEGGHEFDWRQPVTIMFGEVLEPADFHGPQARQDFRAELRRRIEQLIAQAAAV